MIEYNFAHWQVVKYDKKALNILKNAKLNEQQINELERCMKEIKKYQVDVFPDMYKLYVNEMSIAQLSKYYNRGEAIIHKLFINLGINRSIKEAQEIAGKYRNYHKIRKTFKRTMKERFIKTQLFGSDIENIVRLEFQQSLNSLLGHGFEVIIGINSIFDGEELDIPIIIVYKNIFYKYGIEVGNGFMHKNRGDKDDIKISKLEKMGYNIIKLDTDLATVFGDGHVKDYSLLKNKVKIIGRKIKKEMLSKR